MFRNNKLIYIFTLLCLFMQHANAEKVIMMTETYPPYNMVIEGELTGISVELLDAMLSQMGAEQSKSDIKLLPWARGYKLLKKKKNHLLFSTYRTPERENEFKWVGPIITVSTDLIALKKKKIIIENLEDVKQYKIAGIIDWAGIATLVSLGVSKKSIKEYGGKDATKQAFEAMDSNTIDLFIYSIGSIKSDPYLKAFSAKNYESVYTISNLDLYYAFNKATDDKVIKKFQDALHNIKASGLYQSIIEKY